MIRREIIRLIRINKTNKIKVALNVTSVIRLATLSIFINRLTQILYRVLFGTNLIIKIIPTSLKKIKTILRKIAITSNPKKS
jgi:hypothetical protein